MQAMSDSAGTPTARLRRDRESAPERREIVVRGIVQGVGFRPFVYSLAHQCQLAGWVRNDSRGVTIEVEGSPEDLAVFLRALQTEAPPLAVVESLRWTALPARGERGFRIAASHETAGTQALVSPDVATCVDCLRELFDPLDRRFRYPFINCTNCGPRFTITRSVPYDRAATTMAAFPMCEACRAEYDDPGDRRFHAQPNACPACGPTVRLVDGRGRHLAGADPAVRAAVDLLRGGAIVAVKGLGGYHLACDPFNHGAVSALRERKARQDKPFALMAGDLDEVRRLCALKEVEATTLASPGRPIVLLERRDAAISPAVAPRQSTLGVMLAYTPLHALLLQGMGGPLVMTSGNRSDEPIAFQDDTAPQAIGHIADYFLSHDRPIHTRCDDSVLRVVGSEPYPVRRSRGYAPAPLRLAEPLQMPLLACGGELKNTFCLGKDRRAYLSHHIGDLESGEAYRAFTDGIERYARLFGVEIAAVAHDLHPDYLSTQYALELADAGIPAVGVQHHQAHIAACLADNERPARERAIGVALDGTGFGTDGAIWGGEFFVGSVADGFTRRAHLAYVPLPGGVAAIREPWRMAIAHLLAVWDEEEVLALPLAVVRHPGERSVRQVCRLVAAGLNSPPTSSMGRLFDAVAALLDLPGSRRTTYEGQAAIELELAAAGRVAAGYPFSLAAGPDGRVVETGDIIRGVVDDLLAGREPATIASRFHGTVIDVVLAVCERLREGGAGDAIALSGGTFGNLLLLRGAIERATERGFRVYRHRRVPPNDGGLALGQLVLANGVVQREREGI